MSLYRSDSGIEKDVKEKLLFEPSIDATKIQAAVDSGIVTLFGTVSSYFEKIIAERVTKGIEGVKGIANEIKVDLAAKYKRSDTDLAKAVVNAIKWDISVPEEAIQASVEDGHVTLTGNVDWWYQRNSAEKAVRTLTGVKSVTNQIAIFSEITPKDVKKKIMEEFHRNASVDAAKIQVKVDGNTVVLNGNVRSWLEMKEALRAAWSIAGVTKVENQLIIQID